MDHDSLFKRISIGTIWIWLGALALIPTMMVLVASLLTRGEAELFRLPVTFESYLRMADPLYMDVFRSSLYLALLTTLFCLLIGYPFAYLLARFPKRYRQILLVLVIVPFWTSSLIRTYAMIIILRTRGILNGLLQLAGLIDEPLSILYSSTAVFIGLVYSLLPFMVLPLYATIEKLDPRLVEAARDLGASRLKAFLKVDLPLTTPGIVAGSMLVFLPALGIFYIPDLLGGAKTLLVGSLIKSQFLTASDWPFGSALSVMLTFLMALLLLLYYKSLKMARKQDWT